MSGPGAKTRARILDATLETLRTEGIVGTSARAIARQGAFNQALIFYHFGSVDDAVVAAVAQLSEQRRAAHHARLERATSLPDLIRIARELHHQDRENDDMTVLAQAFAGAAGNPEMGPKLYAELEPWTDLVADTIERVLGDLPLVAAVPHRRIADAIGALFLGTELLDDLDPARGHAEGLFDSLEALAELIEDLLATPLLELLRPE